MKQYTIEQINDGMKRLFDVDYQLEGMIQEMSCVVYSTKDDNFKMLVRKSDGSFFGYEKDTNKIVPPHGQVQSIRGL